MIKDLLPSYYEDRGPGPITYEPIRSIMVDGHEVWWAEFRSRSGPVKDDPDQEFYEFSGRCVVCECDFTPGVGYEVKDGRIYSLDGEKECLPRKAAIHLRHLELRAYYREHLKSADPWGEEFKLKENVKTIILDLIEKAKAGEWIGEDGNGAGFWGGYFYLQTVAAITDQFVGHLWDDVYEMVRDKQIGLEGAVVQEYREPPPDKWEEFIRFEDEDGWVGIASLPGNRKMAKEWKLEILRPNGKSAYAYLPGLGLGHDPIFGPDVEDVARAEVELKRCIANAKRPRSEPKSKLVE